MIVTTREVDLSVGERAMRVLVTEPRAEGRFPGILLYSDIFQITGSHFRLAQRLAGYGFVVASPEIFHRRERRGAAIPFDDAGRTRGLANAADTAVADFDADAHAVIAWLDAERPRVRSIGAVGFCIGGHLAFRAALHPAVRASALFYPTGLHDGRLGKDADAGSLARAAEIKGALHVVFGTRDPHVPEPARATIAAGLASLGRRFTTSLYDAEHAFMRDEGPRFDPEATDVAWAEAVAFLRQNL
ncbi:MAG: dienelactone hydrolase family protein [Polyangiaceae bacterium]